MQPGSPLVSLALCCFVTSASAHGGGLNAEGCHNNRKTGDYHCHRAQSMVVQETAPRQQQQQVNALSPAPLGPSTTVVRPGMPTCYIGPRGGTYTITASGNKNYKGC